MRDEVLYTKYLATSLLWVENVQIDGEVDFEN